MTHDELLAKFKDLKPESRVCKALRAVVELHKPYRKEHYWAEGLDSRPQDFCGVCIKASKNSFSTYPDTALPVYYPCPTIQAIEKELA